MPAQDQPVAISSQRATLRARLIVGGVAVSINWNVDQLPRQFVNALQTAGGLAASLVVEWAIRDSSTPDVPEWLPLQTINLVAGGTVPVNTFLGASTGGTGAVWLRFTLTGVDGDTCELAATAFV